MEFTKSLPPFNWAKVSRIEEALKEVNQGTAAIHFAGGEGGEDLGPEGCEDLLLRWKNVETLMALKIGENDIDEDAAESLSRLLIANENILYFSVYSNDLTINAARSLCNILNYNKTLVALQLFNSKMGADSAQILAKEIEVSNRTLLQLDVSNNQLGDEGAKYFAKALRVNDVLTTLGLGSNKITEPGFRELTDALEVNFTLCTLDLEGNVSSDFTESRKKNFIKRNTDALKESVLFCNQNVKTGPLRKAKICFIGKHGSGKSALINALKGNAFVEEYNPTEGAKVSQVLTRLKGEAWHGVSRMPSADFAFHFLSRFVNVKLDEKVELVEQAQEPVKEIGFAAFKKRRNRRGSVQQRRGSVTGQKRNSINGAIIMGEDRKSTVGASSRQSRRSSVAMSVLNAFMGEAGASSNRRSIKGVLEKFVHPHNRKINDLLDDKEYLFYGEKDRVPGEATKVYDEGKLGEMFDPLVIAKSRRERDCLGFNILELSGERAFYTVHHAFLTEDAVFVLTFNMEHFVSKQDGDNEKRLDEIRYLNYWLKAVKYHAPEATLVIVGTNYGKVTKEQMSKIESDLSKLVFPELHKVHAARKQAMKLNAAVQAANEFAKEMAQEKDGGTDMLHKKMNLFVNEKDRRLFFAVELSSDKGVDNVRLAIDSAAQKQQYYGQKIPVRWLKFLDALRNDSDNYFCTPDRVEALAFQTLQKDEKNPALKLFHELGYIIHIKEIEQLQNFVITDTINFYKVIFKLIFTEDLTLFDFAKAKKDGLEKDLVEALDTGKVSQKLLDFIWKDESILNQVGNEKEDLKGKKFFLDYAQLNLIIAQYNFLGQKDKYIIPSMIPANLDIIRKTKEDFGEGLNLKCKFRFRGYLTLGVFERLLCLCVQFAGNQSNSLEPIMSMGWAQISFGMSFVFRLERMPDDIILTVLESKKRPFNLVKNFDKMFMRLRQFLGKGFMWTVSLQDGNGEYISYEEAKNKKLEGWFTSSKK